MVIYLIRTVTILQVDAIWRRGVAESSVTAAQWQRHEKRSTRRTREQSSAPSRAILKTTYALL